ncbi:MAG: nucleoside deaminase [Parasphingorhabdus sp.]|nr:nucleoside deaminase [Parasphingorhabdus sp.]
MPLNHARKMMELALAEARMAADAGEVPVGAIVARNGIIIARAHNSPRAMHDPTAHAEMLAIRKAAEALGDDRLTGCELWVTLEPCAMCAGAIAHARIARVHYAAEDPKGGAVVHGPKLFSQITIHHRPEISSGIGAEESIALLKKFFASRRG